MHVGTEGGSDLGTDWQRILCKLGTVQRYQDRSRLVRSLNGRSSWGKDENGKSAGANDGIGTTSKDAAHYGGSAVGLHGDKVSAHFFGDLEDLSRRRARSPARVGGWELATHFFEDAGKVLDPPIR
jgi:hypothetical protein